MLLPAYKTFGLVFVHENIVQLLPLRGINVDVAIVDSIGRTAISQHFHNTNPYAIEAIYVFPIDEKAAVCGFEVEIDGFAFVALPLVSLDSLAV